MPANQRATAHGAISTDGGAAGHSHAACDRGIATDSHVMADLNQVVELDAVLDDRIAERTAINTGVGTDFNFVTNPDGTQLLNFFPAIAVFGKAETICANHHARMNDTALTDDAVVRQVDARGQLGVRTHSGTALHHTHRADPGAGMHLGLRVNDSAGVHPAAIPNSIVALPFAMAPAPKLG